MALQQNADDEHQAEWLVSLYEEDPQCVVAIYLSIYLYIYANTVEESWTCEVPSSQKSVFLLASTADDVIRGQVSVAATRPTSQYGFHQKNYKTQSLEKHVSHWKEVKRECFMFQVRQNFLNTCSGFAAILSWFDTTK